MSQNYNLLLPLIFTSINVVQLNSFHLCLPCVVIVCQLGMSSSEGLTLLDAWKGYYMVLAWCWLLAGTLVGLSTEDPRAVSL